MTAPRCVPGDLVIFVDSTMPTNGLYTVRDVKDVTVAGMANTRRPLFVLAVVPSTAPRRELPPCDVLLVQYDDGVTIIGWEYDTNVTSVQLDNDKE